MTSVRLLFLGAILALVGGCGGDGSPFVSRIGGVWSGPLRQASCAQCNDGTTFCVGLGSITRTVALEIDASVGIDPNTEEVTVTVSDCTYTGTRNSEGGVIVRAVDGCGGSIELSSLEATDKLVATFRPGAPSSAALECYIAEEGTLERVFFGGFGG